LVDMSKEKKIAAIISSVYSKLLLEQTTPAKPKEAKPKEAKPKEAKPKEAKPKAKKTPPGINIATGALGGGRFKKFVGEAGARSADDPKGLMKDLGVKSAGGANDVERVKSILQQAIFGNDVMGAAYNGAAGSVVKKGGKDISGVRVSMGSLDQRNGIKFLSYTLEGARNAGLLNLDAGVEINNVGGAIFIYSP
jgi:hypothetical protein